MSKEKVTYRVSGSAALKPEYYDEKGSSASIIDFETVRAHSLEGTQAARPAASRPAWNSHNANAVSFSESLKKAFIGRGRVASADPLEVAKVVGILAAVAILFAFLGA